MSLNESIIKGDVVIINGSIADHGIAIMSKRKGLTFETEIKSDTASLSSMVNRRTRLKTTNFIVGDLRI